MKHKKLIVFISGFVLLCGIGVTLVIVVLAGRSKDLEKKPAMLSNACLSMVSTRKDVTYTMSSNTQTSYFRGCQIVTRESAYILSADKKMHISFAFYSPDSVTANESLPTGSSTITTMLEGKEITFTYTDSRCCYLGGSQSYDRVYRATLGNSLLVITAGGYFGNSTEFYNQVDNELSIALTEVTLAK